MAIELTMEIVPPTFHQLDLTKLSIIINFTSDARSTIYIGQAGTKIVYNALIQTVQKYNYSLMTAVMGMRGTATIGNS